MNGVACNLESWGFQALCKATEEIVGHVDPYSITRSLPLIRELQDEGFDVQTAGYGLLKTYHAKNEYCLFSDTAQGFQVFLSIISQLEADSSLVLGRKNDHVLALILLLVALITVLCSWTPPSLVLGD